MNTIGRPRPERNPKPWQTLLFFLWTCGIFAVLFLPPPKSKVLETPGLDKVVHAALYGVFGGLAVPVMGWLAVPAGVILGGVTELGQQYIPRRTADVRDFAADMAGLVTGVVLVFAAGRMRGRRTAR